ncbi:ammonium transporter [uncultured Abyssibacter sp.]|uniref:ammonium transporter n=1 Tax=uncultured Abyssibacter sp. TaxID=2320202 RepID=UPI0032B1CEEB
MKRLACCLAIAAFTLPATASAQGLLENPADLIWVSVSAALVFFMQAGFALLEGGFVRTKNTVNVIMKNYADLCVGVLAFWALGFGLMFGDNPSGWIGVTHFVPGDLTGGEAGFMVFQMMFAATAATIVSGAVAERMRFAAYAIGAVAVTGVIYPVYGSWVWGSAFEGSGWLSERGFIDFAGSTVVHSIGGWCALAAAIVLGPRLGRFGPKGEVRNIPGHSLPSVALGVFILWLGWFGFNGGSTLAADASIGKVLLNTNLAAAAGVVGTMILLTALRRPVLITSSVNGALAGLVAITAGCGSMEPVFAVLTGFIAAPIAVFGGDLLLKLRVDDVVGAIPVHGFCGAWGTLAAGLFLDEGLFQPGVITTQLLGIGAAFLWAFPLAWLCFAGINVVLKVRAESIHEQRGLDFTEHSEVGYPEFQTDLPHAGRND